MPSIESLSVRIRVDKKFKRLVNRTCKALKVLGDDKLITSEDVDKIMERILIRLKDMIVVGKVK